MPPPRKKKKATPKVKAATQIEQKAIGLSSRLNRRKNWTDRMVDTLTSSFGSLSFLIVHVFIFSFWIVANVGDVPGITTFDPFPFSMLTMIVSLEAIFLSAVVLMSQTRKSKMDDVRAELDLWVNIHTEKEITKIAAILEEIHDNVVHKDKHDTDMREVKNNLNLAEIEEALIEELA